MSATFVAFQTASRALAASQSNINVTGNNISNVNTVGYTRQRVDLSTIATSGYTEKYSVSGVVEGYGVEVSGISQLRDSFLDARYRNQNAENGKYDTILKGLSDLENIFDEAQQAGLQSEISNFRNQLQTLSQSPTSDDISFVVRTAAQKVTQILNVYATQTQEVIDQNTNDLSKIVVDNNFNTIVKSIADLNEQIRTEQTHGNAPNDLYDKRNTLLDELSNIASIKVSTTAEKISDGLTIDSTAISIYDKTTGMSIPIVKDGLYNTLSVNSSSGQVKIEINSSFDAPADKDITQYMTDGTIKGYIDIINGKGGYADAVAGENDFRGGPYYMESINTFARNFAYTFNYLNSGSTDATSKMLFTDSSDGTDITAANIKVSDAWLNDSSYITTTTSTTTSGNADNVLRMIKAMEGDTAFVRDPFDTDGDGDTGSTMFEGTFNEYVSGMIGTLALDVELNQNFVDTADSVLSNLDQSRDAIMGVSLDEEGVNLISFQKSYNAAARFFTVLDEALDILINKTGLVGR